MTGDFVVYEVCVGPRYLFSTLEVARQYALMMLRVIAYGSYKNDLQARNDIEKWDGRCSTLCGGHMHLDTRTVVSHPLHVRH